MGLPRVIAAGTHKVSILPRPRACALNHEPRWPALLPYLLTPAPGLHKCWLKEQLGHLVEPDFCSFSSPNCGSRKLGRYGQPLSWQGGGLVGRAANFAPFSRSVGSSLALGLLGPLCWHLPRSGSLVMLAGCGLGDSIASNQFMPVSMLQASAQGPTPCWELFFF